MTPLQIVQSLLSIGFAAAAWILCAETRRYLIRAQAAATRANTAAERAEAALQDAKAVRAESMTEQCVRDILRNEIETLRAQDRSAP